MMFAKFTQADAAFDRGFASSFDGYFRVAECLGKSRSFDLLCVSCIGVCQFV